MYVFVDYFKAKKRVFYNTRREYPKKKQNKINILII